MPDDHQSHGTPLRCRLGFHHYVKRVPDNSGEPYLECTHCGKDQFPGDSVIPPTMGG